MTAGWCETIALLYALLATTMVSLLSFAGIFTMSLKEQRLKGLLLILVGFAAGALIGGAFLHLMPESIGKFSPDTIFTIFISGFVLFFILEKLLWRHCHERECQIHTFAYLNLFGDGIHNFIDGLIIVASFIADTGIGLVTTLAIASHEVPQEIGDLGVLLYGGFERRKALFLNFITALTAIAGGVLGYFLLPHLGTATILLLPFAAGGFTYIAAVDLVPELHKEVDSRKAAFSFASFLAGVSVMGLVKFIFGG